MTDRCAGDCGNRVHMQIGYSAKSQIRPDIATSQYKRDWRVRALAPFRDEQFSLLEQFGRKSKSRTSGTAFGRIHSCVQQKQINGTDVLEHFGDRAEIGLGVGIDLDAMTLFT
jgi:hypothetical protein